MAAVVLNPSAKEFVPTFETPPSSPKPQRPKQRRSLRRSPESKSPIHTGGGGSRSPRGSHSPRSDLYIMGSPKRLGGKFQNQALAALKVHAPKCACQRLARVREKHDAAGCESGYVVVSRDARAADLHFDSSILGDLDGDRRKREAKLAECLGGGGPVGASFGGGGGGGGGGGASFGGGVGVGVGVGPQNPTNGGAIVGSGSTSSSSSLDGGDHLLPTPPTMFPAVTCTTSLSSNNNNPAARVSCAACMLDGNWRNGAVALVGTREQVARACAAANKSKGAAGGSHRKLHVTPDDVVAVPRCVALDRFKLADAVRRANEAEALATAQGMMTHCGDAIGLTPGFNNGGGVAVAVAVAVAGGAQLAPPPPQAPPPPLMPSLLGGAAGSSSLPSTPTTPLSTSSSSHGGQGGGHHHHHHHPLGGGGGLGCHGGCHTQTTCELPVFAANADFERDAHTLVEDRREVRVDVKHHVQEAVEVVGFPDHYDHVLVLTYVDNHGSVSLDLPGGKRRLAETAWEVASRELADECGLKVHVGGDPNLGRDGFVDFRDFDDTNDVKRFHVQRHVDGQSVRFFVLGPTEDQDAQDDAAAQGQDNGKSVVKKETVPGGDCKEEDPTLDADDDDDPDDLDLHDDDDDDDDEE